MFDKIPNKIKMSHRKFHIGERVFVCDYQNPDNFGFGKLVEIQFTPKKNVIYSGSVATIALEQEDGTTKEISAIGHKVYKIAPRISKRNGEVTCYEHNIKGYLYYYPNSDSN